MSKRKKVGIALGAIAGVLDLLPMIMQGLSWEANVFAFSMWIVIGFVLSSIDLKLPSVLRGIIVSFLILLPAAVLIAWKDPLSLIPISVMTLVLGGGLGFSLEKIAK